MAYGLLELFDFSGVRRPLAVFFWFSAFSELNGHEQTIPWAGVCSGISSLLLENSTCSFLYDIFFLVFSFCSFMFYSALLCACCHRQLSDSSLSLLKHLC